MGAERDADWFAGPDSDRDPEVIDVRRHPIDFRGEGDGRAGDMDEIAIVEPNGNPPARLFAAMWQRSGEIWRRAALRLFVIFRCHEPRMVLPARKTDRPKQSDRQGGKMIAGKRTQHPWRRADELVREPEQAVADQIKMEMLPGQKFLTTKKEEENKCESIES